MANSKFDGSKTHAPQLNGSAPTRDEVGHPEDPRTPAEATRISREKASWWQCFVMWTT